jgi:hypothetical protein
MHSGFPSEQSSCSYTFVRGGTQPLCRTQSARLDARLNQGVCYVYYNGEGRLVFFRIVCTVWQIFLETKCHARWVRSYTRPSTTSSCPSTSSTLCCQEMGVSVLTLKTTTNWSLRSATRTRCHSFWALRRGEVRTSCGCLLGPDFCILPCFSLSKR